MRGAEQAAEQEVTLLVTALPQVVAVADQDPQAPPAQLAAAEKSDSSILLHPARSARLLPLRVPILRIAPDTGRSTAARPTRLPLTLRNTMSQEKLESKAET